MQTYALPPHGESTFAGMGDIELITPDGLHRIRLPYEGEPPHGDSYHAIWINGVRAPGHAWGCQFACTADSRFLAMSWMATRFERKTAVFDVVERRYFVLPFYMSNFRFCWPCLEGAAPSSEGHSYTFDGAETWHTY